MSHLVLVGAYCEGRLARATTDEEVREAKVQFEMVRLGWGKDDPGFRRFFAARFIPDSSAELWDSFSELLRRTTSAANAAQLLEAWADIDVKDIAREVKAPTLVLHAGDDTAIPWEQGRMLASLIPGARLVPLSSRNHLLPADEPVWTQSCPRDRLVPEHVMRWPEGFMWGTRRVVDAVRRRGAGVGLVGLGAGRPRAALG